MEFTVLNSMAGDEQCQSLDQQRAWGLRLLDLKDCLFGHSVEALSPGEAHRVAAEVRKREMRVHTLSSALFHGDIEAGEEPFTRDNEGGLQRVIDNAAILQPCQVRLLACSTSRLANIPDTSVYIAGQHPWVFDVYRRAIDRIAAAGFSVVIENEIGPCIFSHPAEIDGFFTRLDRHEAVRLTWDVQNLWQCGTFPTMAVYEQLKGLIGMIHVKGGQSLEPGGSLK